MSWTHVQDFGNTNTVYSGSSGSISASSTGISVGDYLLVIVANYEAYTSGVSDNYGNTYTRLGRITNGSTQGELWYAPVAAVGASGALTITSAAQAYGVIGVADFTASGTVSLDGPTVTNSATGTAVTSGSFGGAAGDLGVACVFFGSTSGTVSANAPWTLGYSAAYLSSYHVGAALIYDLSTPSAPNISATLSASLSWGAVAQALTAAASSFQPQYLGDQIQEMYG